MEELKKQEEPKKLTYEQLSKAASDLHVQYQKLMHEYQKAMEALNDQSFNYNSFFLQMLFKVMEHPNRYPDKFIDWCSSNIQNSLVAFASAMNESAKKVEEAVEKKVNEKKDEAE